MYAANKIMNEQYAALPFPHKITPRNDFSSLTAICLSFTRLVLCENVCGMKR